MKFIEAPDMLIMGLVFFVANEEFADMMLRTTIFESKKVNPPNRAITKVLYRAG